MSRWIKKSRKKAGAIPGALVYTGSETSIGTLLEWIQYDGKSLDIQTLEYKDGKHPFNFEDEKVDWVNVTGLSDTAAIQKLGAALKIHSLWLEDVLSVGGRPKVEVEDESLFLTIKMLQWTGEDQPLQTEHVSLLLSKGIVLSFQERPGDVFEWVRNRIKNQEGRIRERGPDYLFFALWDAIVDHYLIILEKLGDKIELSDGKIFTDHSQDTLQTITTLKQELVFLRKSILPLKDMVAKVLKKDSPLIEERTKPFFQDLQDHILHVHETIESYRELLSNLLDTHFSLESHRMNEVMKVLTIFAAIFIPLTFIAGIYGMNFEYIPELKWKHGYFGVWGVMSALGLSMLAWFKKKKWF